MEQLVLESERALTILIVEDDPANGALLSMLIAQETAYNPLLVTTGEQAIEAVQQKRPDLFILDYTLPHLNGLELYEQLHTITDLEDVPAILLSARNIADEIAPPLIFFAKPYNIDELIALIKTLLSPTDEIPLCV
jgi:DNA-binding response OmpR family regulator